MAHTSHSLSDQEFATVFQSHTGQEGAAFLGITERAFRAHAKRVEDRLGVKLTPPGRQASPYEPCAYQQITDGMGIIGSDAHIWPGEFTCAQRAYLYFLKYFRKQLKFQVMNGDVFDFAQISRHAPGAWNRVPSVEEEMNAVGGWLHECERIGGKMPRFWTLGNHDARFEARLAHVAPEFRGVHGVSLRDHYPNWTPCWRIEAGGSSGIVVKHRWKGGVHATHNNAVASGRSMLTGHLHSAKVTPYTDYNGTRYGVDCGTLSDPKLPQFSYGEDNPVNHRAGFALLTWKKGVLLMPELVLVMDDKHVQFRGEVIKV